jgi:hypothetical protein
LKCPYCEGELVSGRVFIHGRLIDFLMVGLSSQQLWFARDGDPKEEEILSSWGHDAAGGHRCTACGAVLIKSISPATRPDAGHKHENTVCHNCGCVISGNPKTCAYCGADLK